MRLQANSSNWTQILDPSQHTVIKFFNDEKTRCSKNSKMFIRPDHITDQPYVKKLVKPELQLREPIIVGFLVVQRPEQRKSELYFIFLKMFCDAEM